jgi:hypothetical protein
MCETCRTRWRGVVLCAACVERALRAGDAAPESSRQHARHAAYGFAGGVTAWALTGAVVGILALLAAKARSQETALLIAAFALLLLLAAVVVALLGLGCSAAALRTRGDGMMLATFGLLLSGLHVGALVGLLLLSIWTH